MRIVERAEGINVPARFKDAKERRERLEREAAEGEERVRRRARRRCVIKFTRTLILFS